VCTSTCTSADVVVGQKNGGAVLVHILVHAYRSWGTDNGVWQGPVQRPQILLKIKFTYKHIVSNFT
jgi:hypothetical protein